MSVFETRLDGGNERTEDFGVVDFAQESQHGSADVFVGMIEIVHESVTDEEHFRKHLSLYGRTSGGCRQKLFRRRLLILGNDFPVKHTELLELLVVGINAEPNDLHENARHGFSTEHCHNGSFQSELLDLRVTRKKGKRVSSMIL
jgi:hypothetical protein